MWRCQLHKTPLIWWVLYIQTSNVVNLRDLWSCDRVPKHVGYCCRRFLRMQMDLNRARSSGGKWFDLFWYFCGPSVCNPLWSTGRSTGYTAHIVSRDTEDRKSASKSRGNSNFSIWGATKLLTVVYELFGLLDRASPSRTGCLRPQPPIIVSFEKP